MATVTKEQLQELVCKLRASQDELHRLKEEEEVISRLVGDAADKVEPLVKQGDLERAEKEISDLWDRLGTSRIIFEALSGSAVKTRYAPAYAPDAETAGSLERTGDMVNFLNDLIRLSRERGIQRREGTQPKRTTKSGD